MRLPTDRMDWSQVWFCLSKGSQCYPDDCHFGPGWVSFLPVCNEPQWGWTPCSPVPWPVSANELLNKSVLVPSPTSWSIFYPFSVRLSPLASLHWSPSPGLVTLPHNEPSRTPHIPFQHSLSSKCEYLFVGQSASPCLKTVVYRSLHMWLHWLHCLELRLSFYDWKLSDISHLFAASFFLIISSGLRVINKEIKVPLACPISLVLIWFLLEHGGVNVCIWHLVDKQAAL